MAELNERGLKAAIRALAELAYKDAKNKKINIEHFRRTLETSILEGDRSFCIICHSLIEDFIRSAFASHLQDLSKANEKYIFGEYGLLPSATKVTRLATIWDGCLQKICIQLAFWQKFGIILLTRQM